MSPEKYRQTEVQTSREITRLSLAVKMPGAGRGNVMFVGWDKNENPVISYDASSLSEQAKNSYGITKATTFPYRGDIATLPMVPIEFMGTSRPYDKKDISESELTEDILTYWVTKGGNAEQIQVPELGLLEAILRGQVVWEDFNEDTLLQDERVSGQNMYTLFLPTQDSNGKDLLYLMMFKPPMKNEANEATYRQFLIQTLQTLAKIDQAQPSNQRKGYLEAIGLEDVETDNSPEGGALAVGVLDLIRSAFPELLPHKIDNARLEQIKRDSEGQGIVVQTKIILREFGLYNLNSKPRTPADIESYPTDGLLAVVATAYHLADRAINR